MTGRIFGIVLASLAVIHIAGADQFVWGGTTPKRGALNKQALAAKRIQTAQRTYEFLFDGVRQGWGRSSDPELVYLWSRRWLEAELEAAGTTAARRTAYINHLSRMKEMAGRFEALSLSIGVPPVKKASAEAFVAEAEYWAADDEK